MSDDLKKKRGAFPGRTVAQSDFLRRCGVVVRPEASDGRGRTGGQASSSDRAPLSDRARWSDASDYVVGDYGLSVRPSAEEAPGIPPASASSANDRQWSTMAREAVAYCEDPGLRQDMRDLFEETAATLEYEQGLKRSDAEAQAFGTIVFEMLRHGIDVRSVR
jgi:hypothetical protein